MTNDERVNKLLVGLKTMLGPYAKMLNPADAKVFAVAFLEVATDVAKEIAGKK
jgi:hypothetical protein